MPTTNEAQLLAHWNVLHENLTATEEVNEQLRKPSPAIAIPWTPKRKSAYQQCVNDPTVQSRNELIMECNGHRLFAALAELECRADRLDRGIARIEPRIDDLSHPRQREQSIENGLRFALTCLLIAIKTLDTHCKRFHGHEGLHKIFATSQRGR
jgi:hypothetical protein